MKEVEGEDLCPDFDWENVLFGWEFVLAEHQAFAGRVAAVWVQTEVHFL